MRNVSNKSFKENQNTHFMFNTFFFFRNRASFEIMWKNMVQPEATDDSIIRRTKDATCMLEITKERTERRNHNI
jgi:hypothetical protein